MVGSRAQPSDGDAATASAPMIRVPLRAWRAALVRECERRDLALLHVVECEESFVAKRSRRRTSGLRACRTSRARTARAFRPLGAGAFVDYPAGASAKRFFEIGTEFASTPGNLSAWLHGVPGALL
jgi:hypothetical protein